MRRWWSWSTASSSAWARKAGRPCARTSMAAGRAFWSISGNTRNQRAPKRESKSRSHRAHKEHLMSIEIYAFPPSPRAFKVMAVANYLGLDWTLRMLDIINGGHKTPEYEA